MRSLFRFPWSRSYQPQNPSATQRSCRRKVSAEHLEDRKLMAVLAYAPATDDLTYVAGANVVNDFAIKYDAGTNRYEIRDVEPIHYFGVDLLGVVGNHTPVISFSAIGIDSVMASLGNGDGVHGDRGTVWSVNDPLVLDGGVDNDVLNVLNATHPVTLKGGAGDDQIDVGQIHEQPFADLDGIQAPIHALGDEGRDTVWVSDFDYPDLTPHTYWINHSTVQREGVATTFFDASVESVRLNAGCGADVVNLWSTAVGTEYIVSLKAGGRDTLNVGSPNGTLDTIQGRVTVLGEQGALGPVDAVVLHDQTDGTANNYTVRAETVTRNGLEVLNYRAMERMTLNAGTNHDVIAVESTGTANTSTRVTVNGGLGNDRFAIGRLGSLDAITSPLMVNGQGGFDRLTFNDQADLQGHKYSLTASTMFRSGSAAVYYASMGDVTLNAGLSNDLITVSSTPPTTSVRVNAGAGNDAIHVGSGGSVAGIRGPLSINGQNGFDTLFVHDSADGPDVFVRTSAAGLPGNILRNGVLLLSYLNIENFVIEP